MIASSGHTWHCEEGKAIAFQILLDLCIGGITLGGMYALIAFTLSLALDVRFISSLPVMQRSACTAWADKKPAQIAGVESQTTLDPDVVDAVSG